MDTKNNKQEEADTLLHDTKVTQNCRTIPNFKILAIAVPENSETDI